MHHAKNLHRATHKCGLRSIRSNSFYGTWPSYIFFEFANRYFRISRAESVVALNRPNQLSTIAFNAVQG
jgi:hypothetical protein